MAEAVACARNALQRHAMTRASTIGSKNNAAAQQEFVLGRCADRRQTHAAAVRERSVTMVRELHLLTVGFVFLFLGAIVMGVF